jgi:hypothetical protein
VRHQVSVSSSGIVASRRYSAIGFYQSTFGLGGLIIAATYPSGPSLSIVGSAEVPGLASDVGARPPSLNGVPSMDILLPSYGETPCERTTMSYSSWIEGLNKSCKNTPRGGGSWHQLAH